MDYFYIIVIITILIIGYLFFKIRKFENQNVVKMLFPEYTFVLKDGDVDRTKSLLSSVTFADDGAFSKSSEFCELIENVPESEVIHLVIHTNGGDGVHCERNVEKIEKTPIWIHCICEISLLFRRNCDCIRCKRNCFL